MRVVSYTRRRVLDRVGRALTLSQRTSVLTNLSCPCLGWFCFPKHSPNPLSDVMKANADKVGQFRSGKTKLQGFFVGQAVALSGGKADPELTGEVARRLLEDVEVEAGASS